MSKNNDKISIRVEVNDDDRTAIILIPWERLAKMDGALVLEWLKKAAQVKKEWEAKGYRCN